MASLLKLIAEWRKDRPTDECDFRDLFKEHLHKAPYFLRYSLSKQHPNLFMIYITDYSQLDNDLVRECNGIILDRNNYSIVAYGMDRMFNKTEDYHSGSYELPDGNDTDTSEYTFEEAEDGTVLTVFYYIDSWLVATKRNIDASKVKWSSHRNFYQLLSDAIPNQNVQVTFDKDLDRNFTHSFILLHPENHLVVPHSTVKLIYVSKRDNSTLDEVNLVRSDEDPQPLTWASCRIALSRNDSVEKLSPQAHTFSGRGIICSRKLGNSIERIVIDYICFNEANTLRKGMPSLRLSYLACDAEERQKIRQIFGHQALFDTIDLLLNQFVHYVHAVYRDSYVKKRYKIAQDDPVYKTIRRVHYEYRSSGEAIRNHHVVNIVENIPPHILDTLLSYYVAYGFYPPKVLHNA
jgi:hypothetical protein